MIHTILQYAGIGGVSSVVGGVLGWSTFAITATFGSFVALPLCAVGALILCAGVTEYANSRK